MSRKYVGMVLEPREGWSPDQFAEYAGDRIQMWVDAGYIPIDLVHAGLAPMMAALLLEDVEGIMDVGAHVTPLRARDWVMAARLVGVPLHEPQVDTVEASTLAGVKYL